MCLFEACATQEPQCDSCVSCCRRKWVVNPGADCGFLASARGPGSRTPPSPLPGLDLRLTERGFPSVAHLNHREVGTRNRLEDVDLSSTRWFSLARNETRAVLRSNVLKRFCDSAEALSGYSVESNFLSYSRYTGNMVNFHARQNVLVGEEIVRGLLTENEQSHYMIHEFHT